MEIYLNGQVQQILEASNVAELILQLDLAGKRYALELNHTILPRSEYAQTPLCAGDKIEIIHAVGGG